MTLLPKSRKARRRLVVLAAAAPILALAVGLSLYAMRDAVVFFYGPSEAHAKQVPPGRTVRIGGLVAARQRGQGAATRCASASPTTRAW